MADRKTPPMMGFDFGRPPSDQMNYMEFGDQTEGEESEEESGEKAPKSVAAYINRKCRDCKYFLPEDDCQKVDRASEGDDPGIIHPEGYCNRWTNRNEEEAMEEGEESSIPQYIEPKQSMPEWEEVKA